MENDILLRYTTTKMNLSHDFMQKWSIAKFQRNISTFTYMEIYRMKVLANAF